MQLHLPIPYVFLLAISITLTVLMCSERVEINIKNILIILVIKFLIWGSILMWLIKQIFK